jgi:hypothetical protein
MKRRAAAADDEQSKPKARRCSSTQKEAGRRTAAAEHTEHGGRKTGTEDDAEKWAVGDWLAPPFMSRQLQGLQQVRSGNSTKLRDSRSCC